MEEDVNDLKFAKLMNKMVRATLSTVRPRLPLQDAIKKLSTMKSEKALNDISTRDESVFQSFQDHFAVHEHTTPEAAMDITLNICRKILNMKKLIHDYPMLYVPFSFKEYQPKVRALCFRNRFSSHEVWIKQQKYVSSLPTVRIESEERDN